MFRSKPQPESYALSVRLDAFEAGVIKAAGSTLTVLFSELKTPRLCIGQKIKVRFLDGGSLHGREASARVTSWRDRGIHREVEFKMRPEMVTLAAAGMGLRDDFRVSPNPSDRLVAKLRARGQNEWRRALLKDLSLTGIGVLVNADTDEALVEASLVEVEIELPGSYVSLPFIGRIRSRSIAGCAIRHGIEIVPEMTEAHSFLEDSLRSYSRQRQRELLDASRRLNDAMDESEVRRSA